MKKVERFIIIIPICFSLLVGWFSWSAYRAAPQVAAENLRGAGLSMAAAIEQLGSVDAGFKALARYSTSDIAYFSLIDSQSVIRFHTNAALIGADSTEPIQTEYGKNGILEGRKKLGTGEEIYLLQTLIHSRGTDYNLNLALHTYRADQVIRRAQTELVVVIFLTISLWIVTLGIMYLLRRDERRQKEMQRREELARLGELGAVMAHEIRNPLAGIKGFAQMMESADNLEQARHYADKVVTQSLRMEELVNDLLVFARNGQGERQLTDLSILIQDCVSLMSPEATRQKIAIESHPSLQVNANVVADRILQILLNLIKNGIQAMPEGGLLKIGLLEKNGSAIISVSDNGIGISSDHLEHIFDPFWTSKATGTGLGLALCKKVAEEHGGSVTVESVPDIGTTFTVTLPMEG